jgi:methionyl-tRNA formyltransferase
VAASERVPLRIVLVAEEAAGIRVLRALDSLDHTVVAVLADDTGSEQQSVAGLARRLELPVRPPELVTSADLAEALRRDRIDLLLNVHSLQLVAPEVLAAPAVGSFNLHPGPLPRYAGLDVPSWAIYNRETRHGSSLHWLTGQIDGGPIAYSAEFDVEPEETAISLYLKCVRHGVPLVTTLVEAAANGGADAIPALEQDRAARRYFGRRPPHDGWLLWGLEAERLAALVRACDYGPFDSPWGRARTVVRDVELEVVRASPGPGPADAEPGTIGKRVEGGVLVAAANRWLLVESVVVAGRPLDPATALPRGERCSPIAP